MTLAGQRVLITGGLGFIGSNLARHCVETGAQVTIYDCLDPRSGGNIYNVHAFKDSVQIVVNDLRNLEAMAESVRDKDFIFNCAAYTSHPNSMREPLMDIDVNCKGVINLLEAIKRFNPEAKLVHVGTSTQIGKMQFEPITEAHPEFPLDIYSANKAVSEKYVLIYANAYDLHATVVRPSNVYGPRSNIKSSDFGFINYFIGLALQGRNLTVYGEGSQVRHITYVDDVVSALVAAAGSEATNGEVFFAADERRYRVSELAETIARVIGRGTVQYVEWPDERRKIEIGDALISSEKIRCLLGWRPSVSMENGLQWTKDYFEPAMQHYLR